VYDGVEMFDLGVACEVFGVDRSELFGVPWYRLSLCAVAPGTVTVDGGYDLSVPYGLERLHRAQLVVVPPTERIDDLPGEVLEALRQAHARGRQIVSLCTGAFVLAKAGLLDGRRATTHWSVAGELAHDFPQVTVDPDVLFVDEGSLMTSAGSAAGIDLLLHVVRQDYGTEIATQLARQLVVPPQRDGGQAQFIDTPMPKIVSANLFAETLDWLQEHLAEPVTVDDLASRSAMSPRTFARQFVAATGTTPYRWLLRQRVLHAQRLLESSDLTIETIADHSGFVTADNLRKHFKRTIHTTPQAYRSLFQSRSA
jgi:AraC family transcriptional regulator, transcriptional activator FtrA